MCFSYLQLLFPCACILPICNNVERPIIKLCVLSMSLALDSRGILRCVPPSLLSPIYHKTPGNSSCWSLRILCRLDYSHALGAQGTNGAQSTDRTQGTDGLPRLTTNYCSPCPFSPPSISIAAVLRGRFRRGEGIFPFRSVMGEWSHACATLSTLMCGSSRLLICNLVNA